MIGKTLAAAAALLFAAQVHAQTTPSASPGTTSGPARRLTGKYAIDAGRVARNKTPAERGPRAEPIGARQEPDGSP
jgi:hypothetical protein